MPDLPTADEAFGAARPTAEQAFGPPAPPLAGDALDRYFQPDFSGAGRILDLFGQGVKQGWGAEPLGLSPDTAAAMKTAGLFNDWQSGHATLAKTFNESVLRSGAAALDALTRLPVALYHGIGDVALAAGVPRDIVAIPEAFPFGEGTGLPRTVEPPAPRTVDLAQARNLGVIGRGEAGWLGTTEMPPEEASRAAIERLTPTGTPSASEIVVPPAPLDIHQVARRIDPETFSEYDGLTQQRETLRGWIDELHQAAVSGARQRIADILAPVDGVESRLTNRQLDRLNDAYEQLQTPLTATTEPAATLRAQLMAADERMRDLAPQVSGAYRQAAAQMPTPEAPASAAAAPAGEQTGVPAAALAATPEPAAAPPAPAPALALQEPPAPLPIPAGQTADIVADVSRQLAQAGRPQDEADAAAQLVAAHYEARAQRFNGALGSAFDLYQSEGADIRGREQGGPGGLASGRSTLRDARTVITLFRRADASTFLHETGHQWLAELLRDAADPRAPAELKSDADTVRNWLGAGTEPTRAQHEMFARGFEAYMMEGRAPSTALARVFAQFRQWLLSVYDRVRADKLPVIDSVRGVFDRLVGMPAEIALAPDRELPLGYDEAHARAAESTPPAQAEPVAAVVRDERDRAADAELPGEIDDDRRTDRGAGTAVAGGASGGAIPDGAADERQALGENAGSAAPAGALGPGRGEAAPQGAGTSALAVARRKPQDSALLKPPPEPVRLAEFVKKAGGLVDEGGELKARDAAKLRPGIVNRNGLALDEAALQAWEAGYMPGFAERPTIRDFLEALDRDLGGEPVYSEHDAAAAAKFNQAIGHNREVNKLADEMGIDPRDWTAEQFWNMAADHLGQKELEREQRSLGDALETDFHEAERQAKAWAESRGDAWEPERFIGRTLEELESEDQPREGAAPARPGEGGAGGAGPAGADQAALPAGAGERGRGAGAGPRGDAQTGTAGPGAGRLNASRRYADNPAEPIDKAGNIRLDNLDQPDDVDQAIRAAAARNSDFLPERRGVLSNGEVLELAEALGKDAAFLDNKKIGEAFNAEEVVAARQLLIQSATAVRDAMADAARGGDILDLARAIDRHEMIQAKVAQATAEAGRALRAFRSLAGQQDADAIDALLREYSGRTLYQLQEMARLGQRLKSAAQVSKFVNDTAGGNIRRAIVFYWVNALISGPVTHLRYSVGNALNAFWSPLVETPIAAGIGALRGAEDRVYFGEAGAQLYGMMKGSRDGLSAAWEALRTGRSPPLPGERVPEQFAEAELQRGPVRQATINVIGAPGRGVAAIHSFFKSLRYEQNIQALAYRQAAQEGLAGDRFSARITELTTNPSEDMMSAATGAALKELYMAPSEYDSFAGRLTRAVNSYASSNLALGAKIMIPFLKIGSQITRNAFVERTPLGLFDREVRGDLFSGEARGDLQAAKITAGVALAGATVLMTLEGMATGDGPADAKDRQVWLLNHRPNSLQIGNITIPYQGLGQLGMLMRFAANMTETAQGWNGDDGMKLAGGFMMGFAHAVLDDNFMRGIHDALDAVYNPIEDGPRYLRNFATNWLPFSVGMGQVARMIDPYSRDQKTLFDAARARIPLLSETDEPRRDVFGEPIRNGAPAPDYANDRTVQALEQLQTGIGMLRRQIRGVKLTAEQYDDYARIAGRFTKLQLDLVTGNPAWGALPAGVRLELVQRTVTRARESAATTIMMQHPEVIRAATAAKVAKLQGSQR